MRLLLVAPLHVHKKLLSIDLKKFLAMRKGTMHLFKKSQKQELKTKKSKQTGKAMEVLQKFGRGLMLPISVLPFAGILLGIGGVIGANVDTEAGKIAAGIFKGMSEVVFGNLPILFAIAVVITFTGESGSAAFMGIIGYLVFNASQTVFIHFEIDPNTKEKIFQDIL